MKALDKIIIIAYCNSSDFPNISRDIFYWKELSQYWCWSDSDLRGHNLFKVKGSSYDLKISHGKIYGDL